MWIIIGDVDGFIDYESRHWSVIMDQMDGFCNLVHSVGVRRPFEASVMIELIEWIVEYEWLTTTEQLRLTNRQKGRHRL